MSGMLKAIFVRPITVDERATLEASLRAPEAFTLRRCQIVLAFAEGITLEQVSGETVRATLERLGIGWRRAKAWITSPDPEYARKKTRATG